MCGEARRVFWRLWLSRGRCVPGSFVIDSVFPRAAWGSSGGRGGLTFVCLAFGRYVSVGLAMFAGVLSLDFFIGATCRT